MSDTEFVMLLLGAGVLAVAVGSLRAIRRLRRWWLLAASYGFLLAAWGATTLEILYPQPFMNLLEHAAYAAGAVLAAVWCWLGPHDLAEAR
jgi:hypothetical protein